MKDSRNPYLLFGGQKIVAEHTRGQKTSVGWESLKLFVQIKEIDEVIRQAKMEAGIVEGRECCDHARGRDCARFLEM
ncbi:hypothetical protein SUGI_0491440 [Cryptomeria japonica]|nr:hypothetical protein SUGI_0491440 [Cryptomeria japonica]